MANAKQCDICKTFYPAVKANRRAFGFEYPDSAILKMYDPYLESTEAEKVEEIEVCPDCMRAIKNYIEGLKVSSIAK